MKKITTEPQRVDTTFSVRFNHAMKALGIEYIYQVATVLDRCDDNAKIDGVPVHRLKTEFKQYCDLLVTDVIRRVNPPMWRCRDFMLNEYEIRTIMLRVAKGNISAADVKALKITDRLNDPFTVNDKGVVQSGGDGLNVISTMIKEQLQCSF